jgi:hypothetical protein
VAEVTVRDVIELRPVADDDEWQRRRAPRETPVEYEVSAPQLICEVRRLGRTMRTGFAVLSLQVLVLGVTMLVWRLVG